MKTFKITIIALILIVISFLNAEESAIDSLKKKYDFQNWKGRNTPLINGFHLQSLKLADSLGTVKIEHREFLDGSVRIHCGKKLYITVKVKDSALKAQEELIRYLMGIQITAQKEAIGDNGFSLKWRESSNRRFIFFFT